MSRAARDTVGGSGDPKYSSLAGLRPPDNVSGQTDNAVFPEEEQYRGRTRGGHELLPPPQFTQQASSSGDNFTDSGTRVTPEFKITDHKSGDLKFADPGLGMGEY